MTLKKLALAMFAAATMTGASLATNAASAAGIQLGQLTCDVDGGVGFIFGSSKNMTCRFLPANSSLAQESYRGTINKFGIDLGVTSKTVIAWTVVAAESDVFQSGALAGTYSGATASAAFAAGLGANVLVGGSGSSFALQPLSVSASQGVNVAVGIAQIRLR